MKQVFYYCLETIENTPVLYEWCRDNNEAAGFDMMLFYIGTGRGEVNCAECNSYGSCIVGY